MTQSNEQCQVRRDDLRIMVNPYNYTVEEVVAAKNKLQQALDNPVQGWRPIETAPHNKEVLLYCPDLGCPTNKERIELGYASHGWKNERVSNISRHSWATHWQPLPQPPQGDL